MRKYLYLFTIISLLVSCNQPASYRSSHGGVWNTTFNIVYRSDRNLDDSIRAVMKQVEMSLSPFNDSSLISRINKGQPVIADTLLRRVFSMSRFINRLSDGAFDPTVSPLINLWGFGWEKSSHTPTNAEIDSALALVGIDSCRLMPDGTISGKRPGTQFNFSAITKGFGVDLIGEMFVRNNVTDYLIEIGGEISVRGTNPKGQYWRIMIDAPIDNDTAIVHSRMTVITPQSTDRSTVGVATSGNYRNYRITDNGRRVWHTISPKTGMPAISDAISATVIAPTCAMADALATACMAMTATDAISMLDSIPDVTGLIVTTGPDSTFHLIPSARFPAFQ